MQHENPSLRIDTSHQYWKILVYESWPRDETIVARQNVHSTGLDRCHVDVSGSAFPSRKRKISSPEILLKRGRRFEYWDSCCFVIGNLIGANSSGSHDTPVSLAWAGARQSRGIEGELPFSTCAGPGGPMWALSNYKTTEKLGEARQRSYRTE